MIQETKHDNGTHLRIYDSEGLIAAFSIDDDAVNVAAELFNKYVGVNK